MVSLIPLLFKAINLLLIWLREVSYSSLLCLILCVIWVIVGRKAAEHFERYGKALLAFNWLGFFCLLFALVYYTIVPYQPTDISTIWFPLGITQYVAGDLIAQLFSFPFPWGYFFYQIYETGNPGLLLVLINTLAAFLLFTIGYGSKKL